MKRKPLAVLLLLLAALSAITAEEADIAGALARMDKAITESEADFTREDAYYIGRAAAAHIGP